MKNVLFLVMLFSAMASFGQKSFKVEVVGKGEPVLLFPGFTCPGEVWDETVAELSKDHACHVFTFAGFGGVAPIDTPWFSTIKAEVVKYVKEKNLYKSTIIGHSLGGTLGLWLAAEEPTLFKKLIVVDGLPGAIAMMNPMHKKGDIIPYDNPQAKAQLEMDSDAFDKMSLQMVGFMAKNKDKHALLAGWMKQADRKTYVYGYIDYLNTDLRVDIAKIKIPVVVLAATFPSRQMVEPNYQKQFEKLPGVTFEYAENSAHFIMFDQPKWFLEKVKQYIY